MMDVQYKTQLLLLVLTICCYHLPALSYNSDMELDHFEFPESDPDDASDLQKRLSKFVRIGRGLSSFIRIGRQNLDGSGALYPLEDLPDDDFTDSNEGAFYDFEPTRYDVPEKSLGAYVGLDRNYDDEDDDNLSKGSVQKRGGAFIRMGKFPMSAFLPSRPGRVHQLSPSKYYRRTGRIGHSSFIRIGKRDTTDALRRLEADEANTENELDRFNKYRDEPETDEFGPKRWLKIGRDIEDGYNIDTTENDIGDSDSSLEDDLDNNIRRSDKRYSSFVRIGREPGNMDATASKPGISNAEANGFANLDGSIDGPNKRISSFVRIGRDAAKRRLSSFVRIGKSLLNPYNPYSNDVNKRLSSFVRIGKGFDPYKDDVNKRISSFVRIGKSFTPSDPDLDKRYSSFVRIGKSLDDDVADDVNKRYSSFVRIGRGGLFADEDLPKHHSSFIQVGKENQDADDNSGLDKRYSSFVRIGKNIPDPVKRYSSFVRIGKNVDQDIESRLNSYIRAGENPQDEIMSDANSDSGMVELPTYFSEETEHVIDKRATEKDDNAVDAENSNAETSDS